jgi:hypothetical protein
MAEQEHAAQSPEHRRQNEEQVPLLGEDGVGAASTFSKTREAISKRFERFEEIMARLNTPETPTAGPSAPLGQQQAHQVGRPARSTAPVLKEVSNVRLVQGFRQTSGE